MPMVINMRANGKMAVVLARAHIISKMEECMKVNGEMPLQMDMGR
jgi:hypothetical protein